MPTEVERNEAAPALVLSFIRTVTPIVAGYVLALLARAGIESAELAAEVNGLAMEALTLVATGVYYVVVRWLETFRSSKWGWLLGAAKTPEYAA